MSWTVVLCNWVNKATSSCNRTSCIFVVSWLYVFLTFKITSVLPILKMPHIPRSPVQRINIVPRCKVMFLKYLKKLLGYLSGYGCRSRGYIVATGSNKCVIRLECQPVAWDVKFGDKEPPYSSCDPRPPDHVCGIPKRMWLGYWGLEVHWEVRTRRVIVWDVRGTRWLIDQ